MHNPINRNATNGRLDQINSSREIRQNNTDLLGTQRLITFSNLDGKKAHKTTNNQWRNFGIGYPLVFEDRVPPPSTSFPETLNAALKKLAVKKTGLVQTSNFSCAEPNANELKQRI